MDYQQYVRDNEDAIRHKDSRIDACIDCEYFMPATDCDNAFCSNAKSQFHLMDIGKIALIDAEGSCIELNSNSDGFYVEDLNAYINDVNNFCYRVISTCSGGLVNTSDKLILSDKAEKLIKRTKKEADNGTEEEKH